MALPKGEKNFHTYRFFIACGSETCLTPLLKIRRARFDCGCLLEISFPVLGRWFFDDAAFDKTPWISDYGGTNHLNCLVRGYGLIRSFQVLDSWWFRSSSLLKA
jgi:hypothetical protein